MKRKDSKTALPLPPAANTIQNCVFTNTAVAANEHTRDAVVALAKAAEANAGAISACARCLQGAVFDAPLIEIGAGRE